STTRPRPTSPLFPYTTLFRSNAFRSLRGNCPETIAGASFQHSLAGLGEDVPARHSGTPNPQVALVGAPWHGVDHPPRKIEKWLRSEEHTSELQSRENLVCRLL